MQSNAATVDQVLAELPDDRREAIQKVRQVILENLPAGYEEVMNWGMMGTFGFTWNMAHNSWYDSLCLSPLNEPCYEYIKAVPE